MTRHEKCTIYKSGEFTGSFSRIECRWCEIEIGKYAQYDSAVKFKLVPKGKRKVVGFVESYKPSALVLAGHGHPEPASMWEDAKQIGDNVQQMAYTSHDQAWERDFREMIDAYIAESGTEVIMDCKGHDSYRMGVAK